MKFVQYRRDCRHWSIFSQSNMCVRNFCGVHSSVAMPSFISAFISNVVTWAAIHFELVQLARFMLAISSFDFVVAFITSKLVVIIFLFSFWWRVQLHISAHSCEVKWWNYIAFMHLKKKIHEITFLIPNLYHYKYQNNNFDN